MKKGDVVTVDDFSWCTQINGHIRNCKKQYTIIETGCVFPLQDDQCNCYCSNTVIQAVNGNEEVMFIHNRFLRLVPPKHKVMIDVTTHQGCFMFGNIVEISDKLYKEIKRDS